MINSDPPLVNRGLLIPLIVFALGGAVSLFTLWTSVSNTQTAQITTLASIQDRLQEDRANSKEFYTEIRIKLSSISRDLNDFKLADASLKMEILEIKRRLSEDERRLNEIERRINSAVPTKGIPK